MSIQIQNIDVYDKWKKKKKKKEQKVLSYEENLCDS
jgi:hypothetical protein